MAQVQVARSSESPWMTGALLALSFVLMTLVLSLPLVVRSFLFQPFNIPAGSMIPTFLIGDDVYLTAKLRNDPPSFRARASRVLE